MSDLHILMVDDDQFIRKIYTDKLEAEGCEVTAVDTLNEAKHQLLSGSFDVVIVDYVLTNGTGPDLVTWLRTEQKNETPVIVFSALNQEENREAAMAAGATRYVVKDQVAPDELLKEIRSIVSK